ncbi:unnamed protein product [Nippostrongylus brasiliensis]|uniref:Reverse transcriptase domain-containing protein n=1 Tax=Nippostrongylus brasiliensis TaxID=27835 RepID=A0A0N4YW95_NIPBR|nr:unnamed protein product [Nippostrongylus brasiliensis]
MEKHVTSNEMKTQRIDVKATASAGTDAHSRSPVSGESMRGYSMQGRRRGVTKLVHECLNEVVSKQERQPRGPSKPARKCKNNVKTRVATLNVGTLTGRSSELAAALEHRRIDLCALQETRWSGSKLRVIGRGFEVLYFGSPKTTNGVGIAVSERFRYSISEVKRFSDRLMKIMVITRNERLHFLTAYAPQTGCSEQVKEEFWTLLHGKTAEVPQEEMIVVTGDVNGHRILECACSHDLVITNTTFRKRPSHLISFYSGNSKSQIDYVLVRRRDAKLVSDAKVVPYETVATQRRPLICTMEFTPPKQMKVERCGHERINWRRLKEKEAEVIGGIQMPPIVDVDGTRQDMKTVVYEAARSQLGVTKPCQRMIDRKTWLWTEGVKEKVWAKKRLHNVFLCNKTAANWSARRAAKKAVAIAKAAHYDEVNRRLETRDEVYRYDCTCRFDLAATRQNVDVTNCSVTFINE